MGRFADWVSRWFKPEIRADTGITGVDDPLLAAMLGRTTMDKHRALQVPTVASAVDLIANVVSSTPIKLYRRNGEQTEEVKDDPRIALLNEDTGDTLNARDFWKAIIRDYYLGKGGYAYIYKTKNTWKSLHYVDEAQIAIQKKIDPIFKDYDILVNGQAFKPFDFLKVLRNSKDGASGISIISENSKVLEVAYESLVFEGNLVKKGGNKKGFLKSPRKLDEAGMDKLREGFSKLYNNSDTENFILLNDGAEFIESSATSVELQLNENKRTNAEEIAKLFHLSPDLIAGRATEKEVASMAKLAAVPLMRTIECALNRDLLREREKGEYFWAFDARELLKGDTKERLEALALAINNKMMTPNEARRLENLPDIPGMDVIGMGLSDVIYDIKTGMYFTPNTKSITDTTTGELQPVEGTKEGDGERNES
jgi:HK97 family phage portal protein